MYHSGTTPLSSVSAPVRCCVPPHREQDLVNSGGVLRLHARYYITSHIVPSLQRILGLAGADVKNWRGIRPPARPPARLRALSVGARRGWLSAWGRHRVCGCVWG